MPPRRRGPLAQSTKICLELVQPQKLVQLEELIGRKFRRRALLAQSIIHSSCQFSRNGRIIIQSNEKLEHLGDRVIGLAVCSFLHWKYPNHTEHFYTQVLATAESNALLNEIASSLGLESYLVVHTESSLGRNACADTLEAICGALYLDGGSTAVDSFLAQNLFPRVEVLIAEKESEFMKKGC